MFDFVLAVIAAGMNSADSGSSDAAATATAPAAVESTSESATASVTTPLVTSPTVSIGENVSVGSSTVIVGGGLLDGTAEEAQVAATTTTAAAATAPAAAATSEFNMAVVPTGLVAEPQTPSGKFTTAAEVKPILGATKGNWVAVREYEGKDYLYVTHLWSWRCGLHAMAISVNNEPMQNWPLPPCHMKYTTPNALLDDDGLPVLTFRLGSVQTIDIQVVYDDLSMERAQFERGNVLIP